MKNNYHSSDLNDSLSRMLQIGVVISIAVIGIGIFLIVLRTGNHRTYVLPPIQAFLEALSLRPTAVLDVGILILIVIPPLLLVRALFSFIKAREKKFAIISCVVLLVLVLSFLLANR